MDDQAETIEITINEPVHYQLPKHVIYAVRGLIRVRPIVAVKFLRLYDPYLDLMQAKRLYEAICNTSWPNNMGVDDPYIKGE